MRGALVILTLVLALPAGAQVVGDEKIVAGLSQSDVAITTNFDGSNILVYGAVRRDAPIPEGPPLEVVITVQGPDRPVTVRRKDWRFGIWVNTESVDVPRTPSFYAVATTGPIDQVISVDENRRFRVTVPQAIGPATPSGFALDSALAGSGTTQPGGDDGLPFLAALLRIRTEEGLYGMAESGVDLEEATLFRTEFALPANLTEGIYRTRIFLTRKGRVVDVLVKDISVSKVGLERWLFNMAHRQPLAYGLLSLILAVLAGWAASTAVRYLRR